MSKQAKLSIEDLPNNVENDANDGEESNVTSSPIEQLTQSEEIETDPKNAEDAPNIETTRSKFAMVFVVGFFGIIFLCFLFAACIKASLADLKELLVAVVGALSGTLGFIVGFYYKSTQEK